MRRDLFQYIKMIPPPTRPGKAESCKQTLSQIKEILFRPWYHFYTKCFHKTGRITIYNSLCTKNFHSLPRV